MNPHTSTTNRTTQLRRNTMCTTNSTTTNDSTTVSTSTGASTGWYDPNSLPGGHAEVHAALREQARGSFYMEAVTELLIRSCWGTLADRSQPWIRYEDYTDPSVTHRWRPQLWKEDLWAVIDEDQLRAAAIQRRGECCTESVILLVAASLLEDPDNRLPLLCTPGHLMSMITHLDREHLDLVLAAITHAAEPFIDRRPGVPGGGYLLPSLHPWPAHHRTETGKRPAGC